MLIEINLAPGGSTTRFRPRGARKLALPALPSFGGDARLLAGGAAALLLLALLALGYWRMGAREAALTTEIQRQVTDSTRYATTIALIESLRARQDTITQKIEVIRSVDNRRYVWPHLLDEVSLAMPAYTWLTEISSTGGAADTLGSGPVFVIQGNVGSTPALTRFMKNLESSEFIRDVTLITSEQEVVDGRTIQRFSLEARYRVPDPSVIETVPVVVLE